MAALFKMMGFGSSDKDKQDMDKFLNDLEKKPAGIQQGLQSNTNQVPQIASKQQQGQFLAELADNAKPVDDSLREEASDSTSSSVSSPVSESSSDQLSKDYAGDNLVAVADESAKRSQQLAAQTQQKLVVAPTTPEIPPLISVPQTQVGKQVAKNPQVQQHLDEAVAKQQKIQQNVQQVMQVAQQIKQTPGVDPKILEKVGEQVEVVVAIQNNSQKQIGKIVNTDSESDAKQVQKKVDDLKRMTDITVQQTQHTAQQVRSSQQKASQLPSTQPHSASSSVPEVQLVNKSSQKKGTEPSSVDTTESYNSSQAGAKQIVVSDSKYEKEVDTRIPIPIVDQIFNNLVMWLPVDDREDFSAGDIVISISKDVQAAYEQLNNLQEAGIVSGIPAVADIQMLTEVTQTLYAQRTGETLGI